MPLINARPEIAQQSEPIERALRVDVGLIFEQRLCGVVAVREVHVAVAVYLFNETNVAGGRLLNEAPFLPYRSTNHGTNMPPSGSDLGSAGYRKYTKGFIACHDGAVFMYDTSKSRPFTQGGFDLTVYKYEKQGYNKYDASIKALNDFSDRFGLIWKEL